MKFQVLQNGEHVSTHDTKKQAESEANKLHSNHLTEVDQANDRQIELGAKPSFFVSKFYSVKPI